MPVAEITGIDIQATRLDLRPRLHILQGSQVDADFLRDAVAARGPFDVIVDDRSHRNAHVVETFGLLWEGLAPGGCYVVEDVQTAFRARFGGSLEMAHLNTVGFFRDVLATVGGDGGPAEMAWVERFHNMIALFKRGGGLDDGVAASGALARLGERRAAEVGDAAATVLAAEGLCRLADLLARARDVAHLCRAPDGDGGGQPDLLPPRRRKGDRRLEEAQSDMEALAGERHRFTQKAQALLDRMAG